MNQYCNSLLRIGFVVRLFTPKQHIFLNDPSLWHQMSYLSHIYDVTIFVIIDNYSKIMSYDFDPSQILKWVTKFPRFSQRYYFSGSIWANHHQAERYQRIWNPWNSIILPKTIKFMTSIRIFPSRSWNPQKCNVIKKSCLLVA